MAEEQKRRNGRNQKTTVGTHTLLARIASAKATSDDPFLTSNLPDNHSFSRSLTYTDASTTSHTPHMHAQNGRNDGDGILQGYTDNAVGVPGITNLSTVTWVRVDVVHAANWFQRGLLKRSMLSPGGVVPQRRNAYNSKCASVSQSPFGNGSVTQHFEFSKDFNLLSHSCQYGTVKMFIILFFLRVGK